jgi:hypothetical protein
VVFNRDTITGALVFSTCFKASQGGLNIIWNVQAVTVSPDNKSVYSAGNTKNSLTVFNRDVATGALTYSTSFNESESGVDSINGAFSEISISQDNKNLYGIGPKNALAVFNRDISNGALTYSACFKDSIRWRRWPSWRNVSCLKSGQQKRVWDWLF